MLELKLEAGEIIFINNKIYTEELHSNLQKMMGGNRHILRLWLHNSKIDSMSNIFGFTNPIEQLRD